LENFKSAAEVMYKADQSRQF